MKRWLLVALLLLFIAVAAAQADYGTDLTQEQAAVLEKYRTELEDSLVIREGDPFSQNLPNPLVVIGSHLDAVEKQYYPEIMAYFPAAPRIPDTETTYNGKPLDDYNLILIGGPKYNRVSRELYEQGVFTFKRNTSKPSIVAMGIPNATSAGAAVMVGNIYGFEFIPDKTVPMMEVIPPEAVPVAAATTGIALAGLGTKLLAFLRKFTQTAIEEIGEEVLLEKASYKQIPRGLNKIALLGLSRIEFMHIIASFMLFGAFMAWAVSPASLFLDNLPAYLIGAGLVLIVHEFVHNFTSHRFGVESEFRTSAVGMIAVAITSVLFGNVFAVPGRTIVYGDPTQDQRGKIALSGPVLSFSMVLLFWLLADYGGFVGSIGLAGFNVAFIMAVYEMLPITPMDGKEVKNWKRWVWALFFFPVLALYAWTFLFV
jgi:Zn-dependent protease